MNSSKFKQTPLGSIPEEWDIVELGDGLEIVDGDRGENYPHGEDFLKDGHCLFLNTKNVSGDDFDFSECQFITKGKDQELRKGKVCRGDFVLTTRGTVGNIAFYNSRVRFENIRINSGMVILRNKSRFDSYFLYQLLKSRFVRSQFSDFATGSAQPQLPIKDLRQVKLIVPSKKEQTRIASILSSLDDKIELDRQMNKTLEQIASAIFKYWFVDFEFPNEQGKPYKSSGGKMGESELGKIPEGWRVTELGKFFPIKTGKKDANVAVDDGQYPFFSCSQGVLHTDIYSFDSASILLAGNGDFNVKWYEGKFEAYQRTYVLTPYNKLYLGFLFYTMKYFLGNLTSGHRGSVIHFITKGMIENFKISVPPDDILEKMAQIFHSINQSIDFNKKQIDILASIRDSLLPRLMSGRIRVQVYENA